MFTARELFIVTVQGDIESFAAGESPRIGIMFSGNAQ